MKQSHLKSSNNKVDVEVVDAEVEGATANEEIKWSLCRVDSLGKKVPSKVWCHFKVFHNVIHPDRKGQAACILCFNAKNYANGTIGLKGGNTSGLIRHMKLYHTKEYNETMKGNLESQCQDISLIFQLQEKQRYIGTGDAKELFKTAVSSWMIDKGIPFSMVEEKTFRKMFEPLNKKAAEIVNVDRRSIREVVVRHGRLAEESTQIEMEGQEVVWTTDHWTGPNDQTYSTVFAHFITANWSNVLCILDLKVFKGTTTGEAVYNDITHVLQKFQGNRMTVILDSIGITDTTGNMGKLGQYCRENGRRHGYCTDHNFHRNAILAFNGEYLDWMNAHHLCQL